MKIVIKNEKINPVEILRRAGYVFQHKNGNEISFILPLVKSGFPRFHIHTVAENSDLILNIHLDQKRGTYGKANRHHGKYGKNSLLQEEIERIKKFLQ